jgi:antitoxin ParD1/3/4
MSNVQKLSVALTPEFVRPLKEAVKTGEYTSASEVIRDALRYWQERRSAGELSAYELRALCRGELKAGLAVSNQLMQSRKKPDAALPPPRARRERMKAAAFTNRAGGRGPDQHLGVHRSPQSYRRRSNSRSFGREEPRIGSQPAHGHGARRRRPRRSTSSCRQISYPLSRSRKRRPGGALSLACAVSATWSERYPRPASLRPFSSAT